MNSSFAFRDDSEDESPLTTIRVNQQNHAHLNNKANEVNLLDDPLDVIRPSSGIVNPINPFSNSNTQTPNINFDLLDGLDDPATRFATNGQAQSNETQDNVYTRADADLLDLH